MRWFRNFAIAAALAAASPAMAQAPLPDLGRWSEVTLPDAPFRIDLPTELKREPDTVNGDTTNRGWTTTYGFMMVDIRQTDRTTTKPYLGPRAFLEALGGRMLQKADAKPEAKATAVVTDLTVLGYPAAKLVYESNTPNGRRVRTEKIMFNTSTATGGDDWSISTTRYIDGDAEDSAYLFKSIRVPAPLPPPLAPARIGRMTIKAFGKPVTRENALPGYAGSTEYAFDYNGDTKAWIYHVRMQPGVRFGVTTAMQAQVDNVIAQSNPKPELVPFEDEVAGLPGSTVHGQAITGEGEEAFRIVVIGDGGEGYVMLMAGPNNGRTESMLREMVNSISFGP